MTDRESKIIVHSTYYNVMEANIILARLQDEGISCFLTDENITSIQPLYNQAVGGVKLHIFEKDYEQVNDLLGVDNSDMLEASNSGISCPKCGSNDVGYVPAAEKRFSLWVTLVSFFFLVFPFKANKVNHCFSCREEF